MRRGVCILSLVLAACLAAVGQEGENFVVERTFTSAGEYSDVVTYYDGVGRLAAVETNGGSYRTDYGYNVWGWLTEISSPNLDQTLRYETAYEGSTPYWNGNISSITSDNKQPMPDGSSVHCGSTTAYLYDGMGRLTAARYAMLGGPSDPFYRGDYSASYGYDLNSNMVSLVRKGQRDRLGDGDEVLFNGYGTIDSLAVALDGNRLLKVKDYMGEVVYGDAFDFRDGADEDVEYEYDSNGNMTVDLNRGIKEIEYDLNNRPVSVTFSTRPAEQRTKYLYDASGRKLRTTYQTSRFASLGPGDLVHVDTLKLGPGIGGIGGIGGLKPLSSPAAGIGGSFFDPGLAKDPVGMLDMWQTSYVRDYCGDIIYKDGGVERILTDNGYAVPDSAGGYDYYYYVKDWQGNVRAVIDEANRRMELNSYYPYGMPMSSTASVQPYKYGGKELDRTNGLDMYDFHARQYDPAFPHFITMDELCEKYPSISPYAYCAGNPIRYVDPDGRDFGILFEGNTLTIKAAYYTSEKDVEYAKESAKIWNDMSGMFSVDSYTINFDLQVVEVPMNEHTLSNDRAVQGILYQNYDQINNPDAGGYGNGFMMVGESNPRLSGKTIDGKFINIYNNQDKTTGAHEMGHTLGLGHSSVGLMTPSASDLWRTNKIGAKEVETIIRNGMMGEILKEGNSSPGKGILLNKPMNPLEEYKVKRIK